MDPDAAVPGCKTRWGTWYPVPSHVATGYTFRVKKVKNAMYCDKCGLKCRVTSDFALSIHYQESKYTWCASCYLSWGLVNDVLIYTSHTPIEFKEKSNHGTD